MFKFIIIKIFFLFYFSLVSAEVIKKIEIEGNDRIPDETIVMFSKVRVNDDINQNDLNNILKEIYAVSYTHLRAHETGRKSRMPSSA